MGTPVAERSGSDGLHGTCPRIPCRGGTHLLRALARLQANCAARYATPAQRIRNSASSDADIYAGLNAQCTLSFICPHPSTVSSSQTVEMLGSQICPPAFSRTAPGWYTTSMPAPSSHAQSHIICSYGLDRQLVRSAEQPAKRGRNPEGAAHHFF